jgi:hypothetical protein
VELLPQGKQIQRLRSKFEAVRQVYNACLGESLKRLRLMRERRRWKQAGAMPKGNERNAAFKALGTEFGFREYDIGKWATQFTQTWIADHIPASVVEKTAHQAFESAERYAYDKPTAGGKRRRRPSFRRKGELRAIPGKAGSSPAWKPDINSVQFNAGRRAPKESKKLTIPAKIDPADPVQAHGLKCKIKHTNVVRRVIRGKERFFAQLVCEGTAYRKSDRAVHAGVAGVDLGVSTIAAVGEKGELLETFCAELANPANRLAKLQQAIDRSRRANNRDKFDEKGKVRPRKEWTGPWVESMRYKRLRQRVAKLHWKQSEYRKNLHGQLVARVIALGTHVRTEGVAVRSWQKRTKADPERPTKKRKRWGKSIGFRAPAAFMARLKHEVAKWHGEYEEFKTSTTKLSQTCLCGAQKKKPLRQRWHECTEPGCVLNGSVVQRDVMSAYLARFVTNHSLDIVAARSAWRPSICTASVESSSEYDKLDGKGGFTRGKADVADARHRKAAEKPPDPSFDVASPLFSTRPFVRKREKKTNYERGDDCDADLMG